MGYYSELALKLQEESTCPDCGHIPAGPPAPRCYCIRTDCACSGNDPADH